MVEFLDNLTQLLAALSGCVLAGAFYLRSRRQPFFLLCCFYGCFGFGLLYWLLYTLLVTDAPPMFYVSDIGWISCFLFLLLLQYSLVDKEERALHSRLPWLALVIEIPLTAYFISIGDVLYNLIIGALMALLFWGAIWLYPAARGRGRLCACRGSVLYSSRPPHRAVCTVQQETERIQRIKGGREDMRKRLTALLLCLCMVLTMLPVSAMAAVGDLLGNTPEQNASLLEKLESFTGESAEEAQQLLDSLGLLDEDGNLITDQTIDLDGKQYTLEEMEALLADPSTDLTRVAQVDRVPIALQDLQTIVAIERELQYLQETYFSGRTFSGEARENLNGLLNQLQT